MKYVFFFILLTFICINNTLCQEYFQQEVNYKINVRLDDTDHVLYADETIEYINNSPDTLSFLYFHLWPNAYKDNSTAFNRQNLENMSTEFHFSNAERRGYISDLDFKINNKVVRWEYDPENIDICMIFPDQPVKPGEKIIISTPFKVKIPAPFSRLGHYKQSYQITQWYPKPAVYDKYGWHQMPYLNQGEFYSEFGSFDVSITVPENYVVAATGNLQNKEELQWLEQKIKETREISSFGDYKVFPASEKEIKTLRYTEENIHDFAWFADKRYHVLSGEVELPHTGRKVRTWVMFTDYEGSLWKDAVEYVNDALYYYSLWNGDYPYDNCTAVEGALGAGGGMEYPTITIIGGCGNAFTLETVIMHEVGHNWFYGMLGSNEREYPYMDEGLNTFNEMRYIQHKYPDKKLFAEYTGNKDVDILGIDKYVHKNMYYFSYLFSARRGTDQPANLHSWDYSMINYATISYHKAALSFNYLKEYLGEKEFDRIMQKYFNTWKFRHPYPDDLQQIFAENTDKDVQWFFNDLIQTTKKIDYKVCRIKNDRANNTAGVRLRNKGDIAAPVSLSVMKGDSVINTQWLEGFEGKKDINIGYEDFDGLRIDAGWDMPEINRKNNTIKAKGLLKKAELLRLQLLGSLEDPDRTQIFYMPLTGWNYYDKFMPGILVYNYLIYRRKIEYRLMPFFSTGRNNIAGNVFLSYNITPRNTFIRKCTFSMSASQYAISSLSESDYQKVSAKADIKFRKANARSLAQNSLIFRSIAATGIDAPVYQDSYDFFHDLEYRHNNIRRINPYNLTANIQTGDGFIRSHIEANYKITYNSPGKGFDVRAFAGSFLYREEGFDKYLFRLDGMRGFDDHLYDHTYLARSEYAYLDRKNVLSHQFIRTYGGFTTYSGRVGSWMVAMNIRTTIPGKVPLRLYANAGTYIVEHTGSVEYSENKTGYELGIELSIIPDIFAVYFPALMSDDLKQMSDELTDHYGQKIRFFLCLNKINPFRLLDEIPF